MSGVCNTQQINVELVCTAVVASLLELRVYTRRSPPRASLSRSPDTDSESPAGSRGNAVPLHSTWPDIRVAQTHTSSR